MSSSSFRRKPSVLYENRYCNQDEFDIVICGVRLKSICVKINPVKFEIHLPIEGKGKGQV